jgi:hypothetical protein
MPGPFDDYDFDDDEEERPATATASSQLAEDFDFDEPEEPPAPTADGAEPEEPAWYESLLDKGASFMAGLSGGGMAADRYAQRVRPDLAASSAQNQAENPGSKFLGGMTRDIGASMMAPATKGPQALVGGATAGLEEYERSGSPLKAAGAAGAGAAASYVGGALANKLVGAPARDAALKRTLTRGDPAAEAAVGRLLGDQPSRGHKAGMDYVLQRARELSPKDPSAAALERAGLSSAKQGANSLDDLLRAPDGPIPSDPTMAMSRLKVPPPPKTIVDRAPSMPRTPATVKTRAPRSLADDATRVELPPASPSFDPTRVDYAPNAIPEMPTSSYRASAPKAVAAPNPERDWTKYQGMLNKAAHDPVAAGWQKGGNDLAGRVSQLRQGLESQAPAAAPLLRQHAADTMIGGMSTGSPQGMLQKMLTAGARRPDSMTRAGFSAARAGAMHLADRAAYSPAVSAGLRGGTGASAQAAGAVGGALTPQTKPMYETGGETTITLKPKADETAVADALRTVLSSGDTGLSEKDEDQLTQDVASGNLDKAYASHWRLTMKSPAYAKRIENQLRSQNGDE